MVVVVVVVGDIDIPVQVTQTWHALKLKLRRVNLRPTTKPGRALS